MITHIRYTFLVSCLFWASITFSQVGYFGSKTAIQFSVNGTPTGQRKIIFSEVDQTVAKQLRILNTNYCVSVTRYNKGFKEWLLGFEFSNIRIQTDGVQIRSSNFYGESSTGSNYIITQNQEILNDPTIRYYGLRIERKKYIDGNNAPFGFYYGHRLSVGRGIYSSNNSLVLGQTGTIVDSSGNKIIYNVAIQDDFDNDHFFTRKTIRIASLTSFIGRNFPINHRFTCSFTLSIPIIGSGFVNSDRVIALFPFFRRDFPNEDPISNFDEKDWSNILIESVRDYNRISLGVGVRYHL